MGKKVLIVGGVAGGASAAARLRRLDESLDIILFERGQYISFANCGLPYHIGEVIKEKSKLIVQSPEAMKDRFNIDVRVNSEVKDVNLDNKSVKVASKDRGDYEENYDYLILSPGVQPIKPNIPGINSEKIYTLRNIPDMDKIKEKIDKDKIKKAIVIGGGFIGVEVAENLIHRQVQTILVEAASNILAPFDEEMASMLEKEMEDNGVSLVLNDGVKEFKELDNGIEVTLNSSKILQADMIILAIGVAPDVNFIRNSGLKLGPKGHIIVNDHMETNYENVYAVGDAIEVIDFVNGKTTAIPLAGPANKQGRIAADNICGIKSSYKGSLGSSIIKVFSLSGASTGNNERTLNRIGMKYHSIYVHPMSHASYYPGATQLTLKLIFDDEGKILGAQAIGYEAVDKTIDVIATAMKFKGKVEDLAELELTYAPPFNSAKSPVNMAGFVGENVINGIVEVITEKDLHNYDENHHLIVDVREEVEWNNGHLENAILMPVNTLRSNLDKLPKDKELWIYCQVGLRGYIASRILMQNGFKVKNLTGGFRTLKGGAFVPKPLNIDKHITNNKINPEKLDSASLEIAFDKECNACGLCCPGPLMTVKGTIDQMKEGETLKVTASDPGFYEDIKSWCDTTGNNLIDRKKNLGAITAYVTKGNKETKETTSCETAMDNKTMVVFSGDLDKAIASFIIANGAATMGKKVTMFFTFWGINILRKPEKVDVNKTFIEKIFGFMMPRGSKKLKLSNMNMGGMGPKIIRKIMEDKNVSSLEELIKSAIDSGVEIVACQMSMELLGLNKEELIEGVKIGGVGYYLGEAEKSNVNLFI